MLGPQSGIHTSIKTGTDLEGRAGGHGCGARAHAQSNVHAGERLVLGFRR